jgi:uncharacterized spore protein YtfJ
MSKKHAPLVAQEVHEMVTFAQMMEDASEAIGAKRVFGEPYEKNGVTVIPAARVMGGGGGGEGESPRPAEGEATTGEPRPRSTGFGGGYGISGRPAGAFVIKGDDVKWLPSVDVNRMVFGFQVVMVVLLLTIRSIVKTRVHAASIKK